MALSNQARNYLEAAIGDRGCATEVAALLNGTFTGVALTGASLTLTGALSCAALTATSIAGTGAVALTGDMTITDEKNIIVSGTTGTKIGTSATAQKLGFFNATPVVQPTNAAQASVVTTATTQSSPYGFATQAQGDAVVTLVNRLRTDLVALGLIKGS